MPSPIRISRRTVLLTGAGAVAVGAACVGLGVEQGVLPGRPALQALLHLDGEAGVVPDIAPGPVERGALTSKHRPDTPSPWAVVRPPSVTGPLPVVVALHGLGMSVDDLIGAELGLPQFLAAAVADGTPPFALAAVDGGRSYWHEHEGTDTGAMVIDDFLPVLASQGLATDRVGLLGWSMGGYGALRLAGLLGADRVAAAVAVSPALWTDPADASPDGFADAAEYERFSVLGHQEDLAGIPVRIECGTGDPFYRAVQDYAEGVPGVDSDFSPGAHAAAYWRRVLPGDLAFLGRHLA